MPSIIDGRTYRIIDSGSPTGRAYVARDLSGNTGEMRVPLEDSERARRIRLHETGHVRWTPANGLMQVPAGVSPDTVQAVEDGRIHRRLREVGFGPTMDCHLLLDEDWENWEKSLQRERDPSSPDHPWPLIEVARATCAIHGTGDFEQWQDLANEYGFGWVVDMTLEIKKRHIGGKRPAWKRTLEMARELDDTFAELEDLPDEVKDALAEYEEDPGSDGKWGEMTIETPPLVQRLPARLREAVRRASDHGAVPRNWHRMATDQRVFQSRRYRPGGGSVLIDQSGSMGLDIDEVQTLMALFPAVTIATYAGDRRSGVLRIIARDGMRASDQDCYLDLGGNTVDGPALRWLAEQTGPRIWVSDGQVVGANVSTARNLILDAALVCQQGGIKRVDRLGNLLEE